MPESAETQEKYLVKFIIGVLFLHQEACSRLFDRISRQGWTIQLKSEIHPFNLSSYYEQEMGRGLSRFFISLQNPVFQAETVDFKQELLSWENEWRSNGQRTVNLDAGYLDLHRVVLLSTKEGPNKIHLREGIWADLNMLRKSGSYQSLPWTFPDLRDGRYQEFFEKARDAFKHELRMLKRIHLRRNE